MSTSDNRPKHKINGESRRDGAPLISVVWGSGSSTLFCRPPPAPLPDDSFDAVGAMVRAVVLLLPTLLVGGATTLDVLLEGDVVPADRLEYAQAPVFLDSADLAADEKDEDVPAVVVPEQAGNVPRPDPEPQPRRHAGVNG